MVIDSELKLTLSCRKELRLCREEMEQDRPGGHVVVEEVWALLQAKAEAGWAARLPPGREEIVSARNAA